MTAINALRGADTAAMAVAASDFGNSHAPTANSCDLSVPGAAPDFASMSPRALFDLVAGYVRDFGSQQANDDLAKGNVFEVNLHFPGFPSITIFVDPRNASAALGNQNTAHSNGGASDPTLAR